MSSLTAKIRPLACVLITPVLLLTGLNAQDEDIVELEEFVTEVPAEESIVPTVRPITSIFGRNGNVIDAPRSVSVITQGQLEDFDIKRIEDVSPFVAGTYSAPVFGNAGVPYIRGDFGELFQNGQRKIFNRNNFPVSFNGVESVNAVKGGAPPHWGFGQQQGGYYDFVTKIPNLVEPKGSVEVTVGEWDYYEFQVDMSTPLEAEKSGIRLSIDYLDSDSYFRNVFKDSFAAYIAYTNQLNDRVKFELNAEYYTTDFTENPGINRPTQALIDNLTYLSGPASRMVDGERVAGAGVGWSNFSMFLHPDDVTPVRLEGNETLLNPQDGGWVDSVNVQMITTIDLNDSTRLINRTIYEYIDYARHSSYYFFSSVPEGHTFETRWELLKDWGSESARHESIFALIFRYESRLTLASFLNEHFNSFDVTENPSTIEVPLFPGPSEGQFFIADNNFLPVQPVRNRNGDTRFMADANNTITSNSDFIDIAASVQDNFLIGDRIRLFYGARMDYADITASDPLLPSLGEDSVDNINFGVNASLTYYFSRKTNAYFSFNRSSAASGGNQSGGFAFAFFDDRLSSDVLDSKAILYEGGIKTSMLEDTLWMSFAYYYQERDQNGFFGAIEDLTSHGAEFEMLYQPVLGFTAGMNFSWSSNRFDQEAPFMQTPTQDSNGNPVEFGPTTEPIGFTRMGPDTQDWRRSGFPPWILNTFVQYEHTSGFGGDFLLTITDEFNNDLFGAVRIPTQHRLDIGLFYKSPKWEARVSLRNVTDELIWKPIAFEFGGGDLVTRDLPFNIQGSVKYKW